LVSRCVSPFRPRFAQQGGTPRGRQFRRTTLLPSFDGSV
jgi:hypothetical protein